MKAVEVKIHNFRSICDATITLKPCGLLVGANNAGKSSVIDAIRIFYGKGLKFENRRDFPKKGSTDQESWVEIEYLPDEDEISKLDPKYTTSNNTFRIRNYFQDGHGNRAGLYPYINNELSTSRFYGANTTNTSKLGEVIYIPAVSKLDEHTKLTGPSPLRELINNVLKKIVTNSQAYVKLKSAFQEFESSIQTERTPDGYSLQDIQDDLSEEIKEWEVDFQLNINPVSIEDIVKSLISHSIKDYVLETNQSIEVYGQGFQRRIIYALIRIAAKYTKSDHQNNENEFSPKLTWILFEEPEAFLHPPQITSLSKDLRKLADGTNNQVLLSTHSPLFTTYNIQELSAICRLRRNNHQSFAYQISDQKLSEILQSNNQDQESWRASNIDIHPDDLNVDMESVKYSLWLDTRRCGAFFANRVLLVEGPTETALFTYMQDQGFLPNCADVYVIDTVGKYNTHRFMRLFEFLGISHYVLCDRDNGRNNCVNQTIENNRNQFTCGIDYFDHDLENYLGIPSSGKSHRKPQHLMFCINSGTVCREKIEELASKINNLIHG